MPVVSVIIPTYNREVATTRALESVFVQSFRDFEVVVVDDGSSDDISSLRKRASELGAQWISIDRSGVSRARNIGVANTSARWLAFLDSDDLWLPRKLEKQLAYVNTHPELRICQTAEQWIRHGKPVNPKLIHAMPDGEAFLASLERCVVSPSSVLIDRELFITAGGFDEALPACEDYDLWLRLAVREPIGLIHEKLIQKFGGHADQLSRKYEAMDRFRVYSLLKLMQLVPLSPAQAEGLRVVLATKLRILATGASKRGHELAEFYDSAAATVASLGDGGEFQAIGSELFASFCERALGD